MKEPSEKEREQTRRAEAETIAHGAEPVPKRIDPSVLEVLAGESHVRPVQLRDEPSHGPGALVKPLVDHHGVGEQAGKYRVRGELARGGVGVVFKGHDVDLGRDVALKFLHKEYGTNERFVQRFVEEAQIGAQLQHPGVVPVYDLGLAEGRPFFTMKLVKGPAPCRRTWTSGRTRARSGGTSCASSSRCARPWPTPTRAAWCTATSSRRT